MNISHHRTTFKLLIDFKPVLKRFAILYLIGNFIKFLLDCIYNIVQGNVSLANSVLKENKLQKFKNLLTVLCNKKVKLKQKRNFLATNQGLLLVKLIYEPFQSHFEMNNCNKSIAQKFILISQQTYNELLNANNTIKQGSPSVEEVLLLDSRANESDIAAQLSVAATLNRKNLEQNQIRNLVKW